MSEALLLGHGPGATPPAQMAAGAVSAARHGWLDATMSVTLLAPPGARWADEAAVRDWARRSWLELAGPADDGGAPPAPFAWRAGRGATAAVGATWSVGEALDGARALQGLRSLAPLWAGVLAHWSALPVAAGAARLIVAEGRALTVIDCADGVPQQWSTAAPMGGAAPGLLSLCAGAPGGVWVAGHSLPGALPAGVQAVPGLGSPSQAPEALLRALREQLPEAGRVEPALRRAPPLSPRVGLALLGTALLVLLVAVATAWDTRQAWQAAQARAEARQRVADTQARQRQGGDAAEAAARQRLQLAAARAAARRRAAGARGRGRVTGRGPGRGAPHRRAARRGRGCGAAQRDAGCSVSRPFRDRRAAGGGLAMTAAPGSGGRVLRPFDPAWLRLAASPGGRAAVAAALVLLAALAVVAVLEPHWRAAAAQLDAQRPALRTEPVAPAWPAASDHASRVSALLGLARRHGIGVRGLREDAAPAGATAGPAVVWRAVSLSAEGRYADLRGFAASALASDAALALDSLVLQRPDLGQGVLRAEFGFAFGHAAPETAAGPSPTRTPGRAR
jgi:hypothetical protein